MTNASNSNIRANSDEVATFVQRVRDRLDYDPATGVFTHKSGRLHGKPAGWINGTGYLNIRVDGVCHRANRLAWIHFHGTIPAGIVDHKNRRRDDNRIDNLRDLDGVNNLHNTDLRVTNSTGFKGVTKSSRCNRWFARIKVRTQSFQAPMRKTAIEAAHDFDALAIKHLGEFAVTNEMLGLLPRRAA